MCIYAYMYIYIFKNNKDKDQEDQYIVESMPKKAGERI